MAALQMRNQSAGNIIGTRAGTKKKSIVFLNSAWDKGDLSDIPRQLPQRTGEARPTRSCFWLPVVLRHTRTLPVLLLISLNFFCVVWKLQHSALCQWPSFEGVFISHLSTCSICLCPVKQTHRRAAGSDSEGCWMPQAASQRKWVWRFLQHRMQAVWRMLCQLDGNSGI